MYTRVGHPRSLHHRLVFAGDSLPVDLERFPPVPQSSGLRGGAQDEVTLQAVQRAPSVTLKRDVSASNLKLK